VEDLHRKSQALERQISSIERDLENDTPVDLEKLEQLRADLKDNEEKYRVAEEKWQKELHAVNAVVEQRIKLQDVKKEGHDVDSDEYKAVLDELKAKSSELTELQGDNPTIFYEVTPDLVAQVVSDWTGIPLGRMARDEVNTVLNLDKILSENVKGQDFGIKTLTTVLKNAKSGLRNPQQPLGVFLLVGPSGVGKTETAINLAIQLFGSEKNLVSVNMSEYQEKHTVSRLVGSPPGYVGYGEGGVLTEAVRQQPYSVVLLDEVEKAHPDILNIFYQVFDKGVLSDGEGKEINFSNTVILLTSNLASDVISEMCNDPDCTVEAITEAIRPILNNHFKPALLARMTVLPYKALTKEALHDIAIIKLGKLQKQLKNNNGIKLTYDENILDAIVERCTDAETGARNIDLIINVNLLPKLSSFVLSTMSDGNIPEGIHLKLDENNEFAMDLS
ncbi:MAG: AAA family ATPase, partial [Butyrivibrio sp.]|nr:AAA family ATPase [Butyrivibrio sp.]